MLFFNIKPLMIAKPIMIMKSLIKKARDGTVEYVLKVITLALNQAT